MGQGRGDIYYVTPDLKVSALNQHDRFGLPPGHLGHLWNDAGGLGIRHVVCIEHDDAISRMDD